MNDKEYVKEIEKINAEISIFDNKINEWMMKNRSFAYKRYISKEEDINLQRIINELPTENIGNTNNYLARLDKTVLSKEPTNQKKAEVLYEAIKEGKSMEQIYENIEDFPFGKSFLYDKYLDIKKEVINEEKQEREISIERERS